MVREAFHDVLFPASVSLGARGGPSRRTDIVRLGSGHEVRRARWSQSLRRWDVSVGIKSFEDAEAVLAFFEAREARRYSFRFRDPVDHSSASGGADPSPLDQALGIGDGAATSFALRKAYGSVSRIVDLADDTSVRVAIDGVESDPAAWQLTAERNRVVFDEPPTAGAAVTAGFLFDVPVRFDDDQLVMQLGARGASVPAIRLSEVRL
ncbi:MAG: DUF2460 domain-containing protein [Planctomycetota bacterium]